ncbi:WbqC family protein [Vicingus serpentipes]|uniref:WbqC family protein n=1 Tax=Vicingus serpentipes TaxID=1926625 RepID=A0A5C6RP14_9FLAO|nr:WbqC family protein [Vicingus serpentipes]TXB63699.1 WbqC family protein [Vicingus serpentipes]
MKLAIMQPYIFPYIGYFQLINAVDTFVFYDDVNFIKRGWINRNQILINNKAHLFSIPLVNASQNKLVNEVELAADIKWLKQFYTTLEQNYKKAPFYDETFQLIKSVFEEPLKTIDELAEKSIITVCNHLEISTVLKKSSLAHASSKGMEKADRLIDITIKNKANTYINPIGGKELYHKSYFKKKNIDLFFIKNEINSYQQFNNDFIGSLSIIDVMMFNSKEKVQQLLTEFTLI